MLVAVSLLMAGAQPCNVVGDSRFDVVVRFVAGVLVDPVEVEERIGRRVVRISSVG